MKEFENLVEIMSRLRKECPWDKKQTHQTLRQYLIEETYEVVDSIDNKNMNHLKEELGDVLLQVLFHSEIAKENSLFDIKDVLETISEKLIRRHPHVFSDTKVNSANEVLENWESIKLDEGKKSALSGVPAKLPALLKAHRIQEKAARVGFDWKTVTPVIEKVEEELTELKTEIENGSKNSIEDEFGDFLFSIVNFARFLNINPEDALRKTINKFTKRFQFIEKELKSQNKNIKTTTLEEMDQIWEKSKDII
ncbi:nucleoside triphosphate pyrophosphohydrolase [candidate division KSB1 bacterium]